MHRMRGVTKQYHALSNPFITLVRRQRKGDSLASRPHFTQPIFESLTKGLAERFVRHGLQYLCPIIVAGPDD